GRFDAARSKEMVLAVGTPEQMTEKILHAREALGIDRYLAHFSVGTMPHEQVMHAIELLGNEVAPAVRRATSTPEPALVPVG
ncbi:MAG: LLM class flavin-dependent oxidoreductase, partial [Dehalococcoidia bacterium]|nr:LLM class flavin-dependent oxidoreductase [Dehalococcoidia bacterium]